MSLLARHFLAAFLVLAASATAARAQEAREPVSSPVLVELFTSQGCSSCPPADTLLGELAERKDVIALSFHVDYWDYIGWKDPFASPQMTARQRAYARSLFSRTIYTPQMMIGGRHDVVGSRRSQVLALIARSRKEDGEGRPGLRLSSEGVSLSAGLAPAKGAKLFLASYDYRHETPVPRGENAGRALVNYNIVRDLVELGTWRGAAMTLPLDLAAYKAAGRDALAVWLQEAPQGRVLAVARLELR